MDTIFHYRDINDRDNNFACISKSIQVNCAGRAVYHGRVVGNSVRKDYYLIYLHHGNIDIVVPDMQKKLLPGDLVVFEPDTPFYYISEDSNPLIYYWVHFSGHYAKTLLEECNICTNTVIPLSDSAHIIKKFSDLHNSFTSRDSMFELDLAQCLVALCISLGRSKTGNDLPKQNVTVPIRKAIEYIHENISKPLSGDELAARVFLSNSRFREIFSLAMGISPKDYIIRLKINIACNLLRGTDMTICDIAANVGYTDQRYFCRLFSKKIGVTPTKYRKEHEKL